ncbi:MAG: PhzF family phenazine biosynthesis protein [Phycisphaerales bacterium]|nr:MAG: PhzF family phenazine biosynthesis protein [Phycisphaerales bacterium]
MGNITIWQVDSFTREPFRGNPAGVCLLPEVAEVEWMQAVASEMNLAETAFLVRREGNDFSIRWFTPTVEVPLCGHATLASAHILWSEAVVSENESITFHPESGLLTTSREGEWIRMDFPALPLETSEVPDGLADTLGAQPLAVLRNQFPAYLVELDSEKTVRELQPNISRMRDSESNVCIVTARGDSQAYDFVSRFFAPGVGIDEDPVTGGAHCSLGPYWAERFGITELVGQQVSKRSGTVKVRVRGDRVDLLGQAVTVMRAEMRC